MKKGVVTISIILIAIVAMVVGIIFLLGSEEPQEVNEEKTYILELEPSDMKSVRVDNKTDIYTVENIDNFLSIDAFNPELANQEYLAYLFMESCMIEYQEIVEETTQNLSSYGLDDAIEVEINTFSGESYNLHVGNEEPVTKGRYATLDGVDGVYLLPYNKTIRYTMDVKKYVNFIITPPNMKQNILSELKKLEISGTNIDVPIEIVIVESEETTVEALAFGATTHIVTSPHINEVDTTMISNLVSDIFGLLSQQVIAINCTEQELEDFGFGEPMLRYKFTKDSQGVLQDFDLKIIKKDKEFYATLDGQGVIYNILPLSITDISYEDVILRWPLSPFFMSVSDVQVKFDGMEIDFDIDFKDNSNVKITHDGEELDETLYRRYHTLLVSLEAEGMMNSNFQIGEKLLEISFGYHDERKSKDTLEIYDIGNGRIAIEKNGVVEQYSLASYVDCIKQATLAVIAGEEFQTEWN